MQTGGMPGAMKAQGEWNVMTAKEQRIKNPRVYHERKEEKRRRLQEERRNAAAQEGGPEYREPTEQECEPEPILLTLKQDCFQVIFPPGCTGSDKALISAAVMNIRTEYVEPDWRPYACYICCGMTGGGVGQSQS